MAKDDPANPELEQLLLSFAEADPLKRLGTLNAVLSDDSIPAQSPEWAHLITGSHHDLVDALCSTAAGQVSDAVAVAWMLFDHWNLGSHHDDLSLVVTALSAAGADDARVSILRALAALELETPNAAWRLATDSREMSRHSSLDMQSCALVVSARAASIHRTTAEFRAVADDLEARRPYLTNASLIADALDVEAYGHFVSDDDAGSLEVALHALEYCHRRGLGLRTAWAHCSVAQIRAYMGDLDAATADANAALEEAAAFPPSAAVACRAFSLLTHLSLAHGEHVAALQHARQAMVAASPSRVDQSRALVANALAGLSGTVNEHVLTLESGTIRVWVWAEVVDAILSISQAVPTRLLERFIWGFRTVFPVAGVDPRTPGRDKRCDAALADAGLSVDKPSTQPITNLDNAISSVIEQVADTRGSNGSSLRTLGGELSNREIEVVRLAGQGLTDREIASELTIGVRTVNTHVATALRKLGYQSRREIVNWWRREGQPRA